MGGGKKSQITQVNRKLGITWVRQDRKHVDGTIDR